MKPDHRLFKSGNIQKTWTYWFME